jgi:uncharacterized protein (TIGR00255 family)
MLQSMTGFGQIQEETEDMIITVEIKSLNNRNFDVNFRLPRSFSYQEPGLRTYLNNQLTRGKIFLSLEIKYTNPQKLKRTINHELIHLYYQEINKTAQSLKLKDQDLLNTILNVPEVMEQPEEPDKEQQWEKIFPVIEKAVQKLKAFRQEEGVNLYQQLEAYGQNILKGKNAIAEGKDERYQKLRNKMYDNLSQAFENPEKQIDKNRFEQEVLFYLEKLDISEELDRLESHFDYYFQTLKEDEPGRRLNFITQEIGREINTIGSKINDANIQKQVVTMKENLEKIKEQVQNIL